LPAALKLSPEAYQPALQGWSKLIHTMVQGETK